MKSLSVLAINPIGMLTAPVISDSNVIQLGRNTTLQCTVVSTVQEIDWTTTALSANISNQTVKILGDIVSEVLYLANVDSGYCGVYTCTVADANMIPMSASTSMSVGEYNSRYTWKN